VQIYATTKARSGGGGHVQKIVDEPRQRPEGAQVCCWTSRTMNSAFSGLLFALGDRPDLLLIVVNSSRGPIRRHHHGAAAALPHRVDAVCTGRHCRCGAHRRDHVHGVATANSVLVISFAASASPSSRSRTGRARSRLRALPPVLMTALAMIIGMAPMALGLGEGGEQNAHWDALSSVASYLQPSQR